MEPNDRLLYTNLPPCTRRLILIDWQERTRLGTLRGQGLFDHAGYLDLIAQELGISIVQVLALPYYPV